MLLKSKLRLQITQFFVYDPNNDAKLLSFHKGEFELQGRYFVFPKCNFIRNWYNHINAAVWAFNVKTISLWQRMEQLNRPSLIEFT